MPACPAFPIFSLQSLFVKKSTPRMGEAGDFFFFPCVIMETRFPVATELGK